MQSKTPERSKRSKRVRPLARLGSGGLSSMFPIKTLPQIEVMPPCLDRPTYSKYVQIFPHVIPLFSHVLFDKSTAILHLRHWYLRPVISVCDHFPLVLWVMLFSCQPSHAWAIFSASPWCPPRMRQCPSSPSSLKISGRDTANCRIRSLYRSSWREHRGRFFRFFRSEGLAPRLSCKLVVQARIDYMDTIWYYGYYGRYYGL